MKRIIGIMWPGEKASPSDIENAYQIGKYCAESRWAVLTGGRNIGVMDAGLKWAKEVDGLTIGILPNDDLNDRSKWIDIPIITNMRSARNAINALSSDIMVVCGMDLGTSSEVSLALKSKKPVVLVGVSDEAVAFYEKFSSGSARIAKDWMEAIEILKTLK